MIFAGYRDCSVTRVCMAWVLFIFFILLLKRTWIIIKHHFSEIVFYDYILLILCIAQSEERPLPKERFSSQQLNTAVVSTVCEMFNKSLLFKKKKVMLSMRQRILVNLLGTHSNGAYSMETGTLVQPACVPDAAGTMLLRTHRAASSSRI